MSSASVEPLEIIDSCFSNQGFNAATMGSECSLRAASRMSGDEPRGGLGDRRFAVPGQFDEAPAQMAPAMHERPWPLRSSDFGQPVITVIGIALQEASAKAIQELLREGTAATGGISEQHDRRTWAAVAAVVGDDRPEVAL